MPDIISKKHISKFLGLFMGLAIAFAGALLLPGDVRSANSYISDIHFYEDEYHNLKLHFHVDQEFTQSYQYNGNCWISDYTNGSGLAYWSGGNAYFTIIDESFVSDSGHDFTCPANSWTPHLETFEADTDYDVFLTDSDNMGSGTNGLWLSSAHTWSYFLTYAGKFSDIEHYEYDADWTPTPPGPSVSITYPVENQTNLITESFTLTGTYTNPAYEYDYLVATITKSTGEYIGQLYQFISETESGSLDPNHMSWISGLSTGDYNLNFGFYLNNTFGDPAFPIETNWILRAINNIPPSLPGGETIPPVYTGTDPETYYIDHSNYTTSTPLYDALSGALYPVIGSIGENLSYFSNRFSLAQAQETGSNLANAVLIARGYANNVNQLLGDLPIAQALTFYLILLILVGVFRLIKNLINLIKP